MQSDNEISQLLRDILEVLRDSNSQIKANFVDAKSRADEARARSEKRFDALNQQTVESSRKTAALMRRSLIGVAVLTAAVILLGIGVIFMLG